MGPDGTLKHMHPANAVMWWIGAAAVRQCRSVLIIQLAVDEESVPETVQPARLAFARADPMIHHLP